ncbi:MAG: helix-turn-helix transcriptional regulator [Chloroflexi bacterium]|nr:helix-turn-helix transcriptional regulator [Chloroflexota bacterium]
MADPTRILILNCLAREQRPISVGELVDMVDVVQSTVSHHLRILLDTGFVQVSRLGTSSLYEVNEACLDCFPATAAAIMNKPTADVGDCGTCSTPAAPTELGRGVDAPRRLRVGTYA